MAATTIHVIRHAHADWLDDDTRSLSPRGRAAARRVADRLAQQPIVAIYSSPSVRSLETVAPLATRLDVTPGVVEDLRERDLPTVAPDEFEGLVREAWQAPDRAPRGGESNARAQARGLAVLRHIVSVHQGSHVALGTHGNLLALVLNAFDPTYGYDFWRRLSFPDVYRLTFDDGRYVGVERAWDAA